MDAGGCTGDALSTKRTCRYHTSRESGRIQMAGAEVSLILGLFLKASADLGICASEWGRWVSRDAAFCLHPRTNEFGDPHCCEPSSQVSGPQGRRSQGPAVTASSQDCARLESTSSSGLTQGDWPVSGSVRPGAGGPGLVQGCTIRQARLLPPFCLRPRLAPFLQGPCSCGCRCSPASCLPPARREAGAARGGRG